MFGLISWPEDNVMLLFHDNHITVISGYWLDLKKEIKITQDSDLGSLNAGQMLLQTEPRTGALAQEMR